MGRSLRSQADSSFERGDTVIVVTGSDRVIYKLNDIFE